MANKALMSWAEQVIEILKSKDPSLFEQAIAAMQGEYGSDGPSSGLPLLEWLRGDEPEDLFESGDSEEEYADFLLEEWRLFGPLGE